MGGSQSSAASGNADAKSFIEKTVSEHAVVLFSKSTCPYCVRVKKLFGDVRADIFLVEINKRNDMSALQDELNRITGARTVMCVFVCVCCVVYVCELHLQLHCTGAVENLCLEITKTKQSSPY